MGQVELTKTEIIDKAQHFGAELIGFASVDRWEEFEDVPLQFHPQTIWTEAKTVIVMGVPLWLPLIDASPSVLGREQSNVTNELLNKAAYRLAVLLNRNGYASVNIPADNHVEGVAKQNPFTLFSHIWAAHYAGLGNVGWSNNLITREYGPRLSLVSVLTSMELEGDPMIGEELCTKCLNCQKICPAQALRGKVDHNFAELDKVACFKNEQRLQRAFRDPCSFCLKVCPVGADRELFKSTNFSKYFAEREALDKNPNAEEYRDWVHIRSYGSFSLEENPKKD